MKILVIDDEEMIRELACKILEREGYEVLTAESGSAGLEILSVESNAVELVLLDFMMEGMSGEETLKNIRQSFCELPCIVSSGHIIDLNDLPENLRENTHVLQKPYSARVLSNMVKKLQTKNPVGVK